MLKFVALSWRLGNISVKSTGKQNHDWGHFRQLCFAPVSSELLFDRPNRIGETNCFLRSMVLQNGNSLLPGAESRVTLKVILWRTVAQIAFVEVL